MLKELAKDPYKATNPDYSFQTRSRIEVSLKYFADQFHSWKGKKILDVGEKSPFTEALEKELAVKIDNTKGDLDENNFQIPGKKYDAIIYSHTIEHQLSPLVTLQRIKKVMATDGYLYIIVPDRTKLLWCKGHYHEIDSYRMNLLMKRAGFYILSKIRKKSWRHPKEYLKGFRPILRLFLEYDAYYVCVKKERIPDNLLDCD